MLKPLEGTFGWLLNSLEQQGAARDAARVALIPFVPALMIAADRSGITAVAWVMVAHMAGLTIAVALTVRARGGVRAARPAARRRAAGAWAPSPPGWPRAARRSRSTTSRRSWRWPRSRLAGVAAYAAGRVPLVGPRLAPQRAPAGARARCAVPGRTAPERSLDSRPAHDGSATTHSAATPAEHDLGAVPQGDPAADAADPAAHRRRDGGRGRCSASPRRRSTRRPRASSCRRRDPINNIIEPSQPINYDPEAARNTLVSLIKLEPVAETVKAAENLDYTTDELLDKVTTEVEANSDIVADQGARPGPGDARPPSRPASPSSTSCTARRRCARA